MGCCDHYSGCSLQNVDGVRNERRRNQIGEQMDSNLTVEEDSGAQFGESDFDIKIVQNWDLIQQRPSAEEGDWWHKLSFQRLHTFTRKRGLVAQISPKEEILKTVV